MDDRGMTREQRSSAKRALESVAMRCDQLKESVSELLKSLPPNPERAGAAAERWISLADTIGRQLKSLADDVAPQLDHWVFEPVNPGPPDAPSRLPEILRTKMTEEQDKRDAAIREQIQSTEALDALDVLVEKQTRARESISRIGQELDENKSLQSIRAKKQRTVETLPSLTRKPETANGVPLLRLWKQNDRHGVKIDET